jgi:hypothetical protein
MKIFTVKIKNLAVVMGLTLALGGCISGGKPFAYTELHEIPAGPGLLSGEEGGYSLKLGGNKVSQTAQRQAEQPVAPQPVRHGRMVEAVTQQ